MLAILGLMERLHENPGVLLGRRIRALRNAKGWTQQELADRTMVTRQTINSLERERYSPSITLAFRLARQFDVPIEDLFLYSETEDANE